MLYLFMFSCLGYEYQDLYGAKWMLVFYHDSSGGVYFQNASHALSCNSAQQYSLLGSINEDMKIDGKYEFLLEYPGYSGYNRWRQSKNPVLDTEVSGQISVGYEAISISWTDVGWGGLVRSYQSGNTLLDGSAGRIGNWYYSIGAQKNNDYLSLCNAKDCFPGCISGAKIQKVKLWIRVLSFPTSRKLHFRMFSPIILFIVAIGFE